MNKPELIDYSLFKKPILKKVPDIKVIKSNNIFFINIISILLIILLIIGLYYRYINKDKNEKNNEELIIALNQYVKENIK